MRAPTPAQLLHVWERGCDRPAASRALLLLAAAHEGVDADDLAALPLGRRDGLLIELYARLFRERIVGLATCPRCGVDVEAAFDCERLLRIGATDATATDADASSYAARQGALAIADTAHLLEIDGAKLRFRLPNSRDMAALREALRAADTRSDADDADDAHHSHDAERARDLLLTRCLIAIERDGVRLPAESLSDAQRDALSAAMAAADPLADLRLGFVCPVCATAWDSVLDPVRFVWEELHAWALRTLREIDLIARVYHWREADILALPPRRRRAYLELCGS